MRAAFLLKRGVPEWVKPVGIHVLLGTFAKVFDVEAPRVAGLSQGAALFAFREFSAVCMEEALVSSDYAARKRSELEARARVLGERLCRLLGPRDEELRGLVALLYAVIGIDVELDNAGMLRFQRCSFSERYSPGLCAFMSAFDSGFVGGLCGGGTLVFESRMTEGAPCCRAALVQAGKLGRMARDGGLDV